MRIWKSFFGAAAILAVLGAGTYFGLRDGPSKAGAATPPAAQAMPVPVTRVVKQTIPIYLEYSARTEAIRNVTLQAKVSGYLQEQGAPDGVDVKAGDLLYRIDPRDYEVALDQAKAQFERDSASLEYLRSNRDRGNELATSGYLAKDSFDLRNSTVRQAEAALAMSRAAVRAAEINLAYTEIRAPFDGRLGRNLAPKGTLVGAAGTALNDLVQLSPIYVTFNPSETEMVDIVKARAAGKLEAEVFLPGQTEPSHRGEVTFVDNSVQGNTGTIVARATIENADRSLLPGQYVRVRLLIREQPNALLAPVAAIGSSQLGKYVYVVGKGDIVEQRLVSLGPSVGNFVALSSGVSESDQVISGNLQKIFPGAPIAPIAEARAQQ
ncbi:efflux RND transporter periplasmic adaptor subunit [Mesorhizobium sp. 1B3]|uniref:efflux RND transporter periplasmic adaptor subunit n=1 Tax=Mesorhizobium sp. 1B3 TaxID=3243599 RepID=UPI003D99EA3D